MTDNTTDLLAEARDHATQSWRLFAREKGLDAALVWEEGSTPDGSPLLSAEVPGRRAGWALKTFARDFHVNLPHPGDVRPLFDVTVPDRVVLVWRCGGVWVELRHPAGAVDTAEPALPVSEPPAAIQAAPVPTPPAAPGRRSLFGRPSGRLPFTRRSKTKENTTA
ncbi:hypothetical protein [Streptomyces collinus]|uniref:hypothetical protein n=1 Tax=Streptomyces collinus TaxID=42684 RepID=UPI003811D581